jgi:hypothetical protein
MTKFGISIFAYLVLLFLTFWVIGSSFFPGWQLVIALIPLVPGFVIVYLGITAIRQMDELQRRMQLEAIGFAFGGFFMLLVTESLLFALGIRERMGPGAYLMYMIAMWLIGQLIARRRYE